MELLLYIVLVLIIFCIVKILLDKGIIETLEMRMSSLTGKMYGIQEMLPNSDDSVEMIAKLDMFINQFTRYLDSKYPNDSKVKRLVNRLVDTKFEESEYEPDVSSYTVNKGEMIKLCVRHKNENNDHHDYDTLLFVVIHELAHVASITKGHNKEFLDNFKWLLKEANQSGLYHPQDYSKSPITYCGVRVTNNPML